MKDHLCIASASRSLGMTYSTGIPSIWLFEQTGDILTQRTQGLVGKAGLSGRPPVPRMAIEETPALGWHACIVYGYHQIFCQQGHRQHS
ncbi:hypothetical protein An04g10380 [Aspergillus niger]|uniref:Uncharacterized protein n=2 Tax=Aspergillus niger TaxID=5061 RepID=A2QKE9_ASPNC|nr:hypothetical protein An04g10380 [Aspergillus niger]CAK44818.1 hypothetical protein An04g10380 [Aspergillus niger]